MITLLGGSGFIASHLARHLDALGALWQAPARGETLAGRDLGSIVDCAGITADFRTRPYDTVDAHVTRVAELVRTCRFERFVYLSSTRLYLGHPHSPAREEDPLTLSPGGAGGLYNLSKAMGEAVTLTLGPKGHVVRLSNVYGPGSEPPNFLASIVTDALVAGHIDLRTSLASAKDYVSVRDVAGLLARLAIEGGTEPLYNVAAGAKVSNGEIVAALAELTGCTVSVSDTPETWSYPDIDIDRVRQEFGFVPSGLIEDLPGLVASYRERLGG
jgi:nucleoside-diphosphate-sugar epimerase